jgi:hypothetical protein
VKSDVTSGPGQPAGSPDRWKKENGYYAQLNKEIHIRSEDKNACILNFPLSGKDCDYLRRNGHNGHNG